MPNTFNSLESPWKEGLERLLSLLLAGVAEIESVHYYPLEFIRNLL
jgi:hypothetical protein